MRKLLFILLCSYFLPAFSQFEEEENHVRNEFIVMLKPGVQIHDLLELFPDARQKECLSARMNIWLLETETASEEEFLFSLRIHHLLKLAQFNHRVKQRSLVPNDTQFNLQWNMLNNGQNGGIAGADIEATEAWAINNDNVTSNGDTVVVAIIDGRVQLAHPDFNFFTNYNEVPGNGIDDDGNGYIDDVNGWNAFADNGNVVGTDNHTMHTSGIAGARGNNSMGVAGVCWGAKILPVMYGNTVESNVVKAYDYVRNMRILYNNTFGTQGAFIVSTNTSFGIDMVNPAANPIWCAMYDSMGAVGILSAAATTNGNWDVDIEGDMPTQCASKWLVTVTSTTNTDIKGGAGWGKQSIDIGAPGQNVFSTITNSSYGTSSGTSMAAPHIAGAIAAMYAAACKALIDEYIQYPDSISLLIKEYLLHGAEWISALNNITVTGGRLNLFRAVSNLNRFNCDSCNFNVAINTTPITCRGANDGTLALYVDSGDISAYDISWSNNLSVPQVFNVSPGFYTVSVTDSTGCMRQSTVSLHNPDTILINSVSTIPATDSTNGVIAVNVSAGREPLTYSLDGTNFQTASLFNIPANGTYTIYIQNTSACIAQQQVVVSSINDLAANHLQLVVFPNPANDKLHLSVTSEISTSLYFSILNVLGETLLQFNKEMAGGIYTETIDITDLPNGMYFLRTRYMDKESTQKFIVYR